MTRWGGFLVDTDKLAIVKNVDDIRISLANRTRHLVFRESDRYAVATTLDGVSRLKRKLERRMNNNIRRIFKGVLSMSWQCKHRFKMSGLSKQCPHGCNAEHHINSLDDLMILVELASLQGVKVSDQTKDLYAQFFNTIWQDLAISKMSHVEIIDLRREKELALLKAKAEASAVEIFERESRANNLTEKQRSEMPTLQQSQSVTDRLVDVKIRKERMTAADKVIAAMRKDGIDEEEIQRVTRNLQRKATSNKAEMSKELKEQAKTLKASERAESESKTLVIPNATFSFDVFKVKE